MKLQSLAATVIAATALIGGSALAQATMQPIPNPPEKAKMSHKMKHHGMKKHHKMAKDAAPAADTAAAPAAAPQ